MRKPDTIEWLYLDFDGFFRYEEAAEWQRSRFLRQLYLDELEDRLQCHKWGCGGACRIALPSDVETEGFQGGLA